jgi:hypothetical protein
VPAITAAAANSPQFPLVLGIVGSNDRPRAAPNKLHPVQAAPDRLRAESQTVLFPQQHGQESARPTRPEETEVARRELHHPANHDDQPIGDCRCRDHADQHAFHAAGGRVALGDLRKDAVERAAAELGGERTFADALDVRDETSVQAFFAAAERALGPVTIAVANAGIYRMARCST